MRYQKEIDHAYQMGREAAKSGGRYDDYQAANLQNSSNIAYNTPMERHECLSHMWDALRKGYEDESQQFVPITTLSEPSVFLAHTRIQTNADDIDSYIYWDWMDKMTVLAAAAECAAGHWSDWQKEIYLIRHNIKEKVFERVFNYLTIGDCGAMGMIGLLKTAIESTPTE